MVRNRTFHQMIAVVMAVLVGCAMADPSVLQYQGGRLLTPTRHPAPEPANNSPRAAPAVPAAPAAPALPLLPVYEEHNIVAPLPVTRDVTSTEFVTVSEHFDRSVMN